jgi:hypothetical protein
MEFKLGGAEPALRFSVVGDTEQRLREQEETMKKFVLGLAIAALASTGPAFAGDKSQSKTKTQESGSATMQRKADEGRGGLSEWPVSKTEADWSSAASGSASSGESTGASGSGAGGSSSDR